MKIYVSGSLAFDRIMDFPGKFADHILPDKIHVLNVCFLVNSMKELFGGTAGNIAYNLALLGEKPIILATAGRDFNEYAGWLDELGLSNEGIHIIEDEFTAGAYITTDKADNQITGFNPGAMKYPCNYSIDGADAEDSIAIVAPGNVEDMKRFSAAYRERGIKYIFDPGQQIPAIPADDMEAMITGSTAVISNDYELEMIVRATGLDRSGLLERTSAVITTLGDRGSVVHTRDGSADIPACKAHEVLDPTGAGDAFRAGLIKGLVTGKDLPAAARMGAVTAAFSVQCQGTQCHRFTWEEFLERHDAVFGA